MTLRFIDSFDHYATADLPLKYSFNNGMSISAGNGRRGAALYSNGTSSYLLKLIDSQQTWTVGVAAKLVPVNALTCALMSFFDLATSGSSSQVDIRVNGAGFLYATRNGTVLGTASTGALVAGAFFYIEAKVKISSTVGTVDIHVNGVSVLSLSSQNTQTSGNATANGIYLNINPLLGGNSGNIYFDDLYICDGQGSVNNTFLGDSRVDCYLPTGNGSNSAFTNNSGNSTNNYTHVNEASQDGDTSYVADLTVNDIDSYAITGISHTPSGFFGAQTNLIAKKDDAGARQVAPLLYRSSTAYPGTAVALSTSYIDLTQVYENDPATAAAWTKANFNATELGVKVTA